jgi:ferritin-like metal-binding protein YciE
MLLTGADMSYWIGSPAMDPYGEPLGEVAEILADCHSGAPDWLVLRDPQAREGRLVPVAGAVPSGRHVRVVAIAERVGSAPAVRVGENIDQQTKARAVAHYGLRLDRESSPEGIVLEGEVRAPAQAEPTQPRSSGDSQRVVVGLRAAHAMEQASLKMLNAMRWRTRGEELVHDLALHHKATNDHAERIRVRLDELQATRARPLDWLTKLGAYVRAQRGRLRRPPEPADLVEACRFEQTEARTYRGLRELAEQAGDRATATLCETHLADEVAMAMTLRNFRLRADPGFRRGQESPFDSPAELHEWAPET